MPVSVVHTLEEEAAWERAKEVAANEYSGAIGSNYWRIVTDIYQKMTRYVSKTARGHHDPLWRMTR